MGIQRFFGKLLQDLFYISPPDERICSHGLPDQFKGKYEDLARNRYLYNVRGHDFLSHIGQWAEGPCSEHVEARQHMIKEIDELQRFVTRNGKLDGGTSSGGLGASRARGSASTVEASESNRSGSGGQLVLLSLGPAPGSFFADDGTRYRWANLPSDLEDLIQEIICRHGYGKISDVTINAAGGWVIQWKKGWAGIVYEWGGQLPQRLETALCDGKQGNESINVIFPPAVVRRC